MRCQKERSRENRERYVRLRTEAKAVARRAMSTAAEEAYQDATGQRLFAISKQPTEDQCDV